MTHWTCDAQQPQATIPPLPRSNIGVIRQVILYHPVKISDRHLSGSRKIPVNVLGPKYHAKNSKNVDSGYILQNV